MSGRLSGGVEILNILAVTPKVETARALVKLICAAELVGILPVDVNDLAIGATGVSSLVALSLLVFFIAAESLVAVGIHPDLIPAVTFDIPKLAICAGAFNLHLARADEILWPLPTMPLLGSRVDIYDLILLLVTNKVAPIIFRLWGPV